MVLVELVVLVTRQARVLRRVITVAQVGIVVIIVTLVMEVVVVAVRERLERMGQLVAAVMAELVPHHQFLVQVSHMLEVVEVVGFPLAVALVGQAAAAQVAHLVLARWLELQIPAAAAAAQVTRLALLMMRLQAAPVLSLSDTHR